MPDVPTAFECAVSPHPLLVRLQWLMETMLVFQLLLTGKLIAYRFDKRLVYERDDFSQVHELKL